VDPVAQTPTEPTDYAAITALYGSLLAALVLAARERETAEPVGPFEMATLAGATFALSKTIGQEKVETWLRRPFVQELPDGEKRPRGSGVRYAIGELLSCTRCLGTWSALGLVGLRTASPPAGRTVSTVLAASAANDFLQAAFRLLCREVNRVDA